MNTKRTKGGGSNKMSIKQRTRKKALKCKASDCVCTAALSQRWPMQSRCPHVEDTERCRSGSSLVWGYDNTVTV